MLQQTNFSVVIDDEIADALICNESLKHLDLSKNNLLQGSGDAIKRILFE
jgi:hypothetical protein